MPSTPSEQLRSTATSAPEASGHALLVGGTGMLREAALALCERFASVSVVARRPAPLASLADEARRLGWRLAPLALDYRDSAQLEASLAEAEARRGPLVLAVCWIHATAPRALALIAGRLRGGTPLVEVRGSEAADPSRPAVAPQPALAHVDHRAVILGFVIEPGGSRWLRDTEICAGVLRAVDQPAARVVVGRVRPWAARP